jgi:hypothetical protein
VEGEGGEAGNGGQGGAVRNTKPSGSSSFQYWLQRATRSTSTWPLQRTSAPASACCCSRSPTRCTARRLACTSEAASTYSFFTKPAHTGTVLPSVHSCRPLPETVTR